MQIRNQDTNKLSYVLGGLCLVLLFIIVIMVNTPTKPVNLVELTIEDQYAAILKIEYMCKAELEAYTHIASGLKQKMLIALAEAEWEVKDFERRNGITHGNANKDTASFR